MGNYLQKGLALRKVDDLFLICKMCEVLRYPKVSCPKGVQAFSIDIKHLYYSLLQAAFAVCVGDGIERSNHFRNSFDTDISRFLVLVSLYLSSTVIKQN